MVDSVSMAKYNRETDSYLRCRLSLPLWICFSDEIKIFLIQNGLFFLALSSPPLLVFPTPTFSFFRLFIFIIYDETFTNLEDN